MLIVVLLEEWSEKERKIIYPLMIDGLDEFNPMDEEKACLKLSSRARWFGAKIVPPRTPHGLNECSGRPQV
jgi:hypothetical protein